MSWFFLDFLIFEMPSDAVLLESEALVFLDVRDLRGHISFHLSLLRRHPLRMDMIGSAVVGGWTSAERGSSKFQEEQDCFIAARTQMVNCKPATRYR